jgi:hypothetical protein
MRVLVLLLALFFMEASAFGKCAFDIIEDEINFMNELELEQGGGGDGQVQTPSSTHSRSVMSKVGLASLGYLDCINLFLVGTAPRRIGGLCADGSRISFHEQSVLYTPCGVESGASSLTIYSSFLSFFGFVALAVNSHRRQLLCWPNPLAEGTLTNCCSRSLIVAFTAFYD